MNRPTLKPISYTAAQVAFMLKAAMFLHPTYAIAGRSTQQLRLTACGRMKPSPAVLSRLNLTRTAGVYVWSPLAEI
jgi:hypothetical protein